MPKNQQGYLQRGRQIEVKYVNDFRPISRHISKTVQDSDTVIMDR